MKVTLELPEALVVQAKKRAAELRCSLRDLLERGLRAELSRAAGARKRKGERVTIRWVTVPGGLAPGVDVTDRAAMHNPDGLTR